MLLPVIVLVIALITVPSLPVQPAAPPPASTQFDAWIRTLPLDVRIMDEMGQFADGPQAVDRRFVVDQATRVRTSVRHRVRQLMVRVEIDGCSPTLDVSFPDPSSWGSSPLGKVERSFLSGVVLTEVVGCFRTQAGAQGTLDQLTSATFRQAAEPRIARMWRDDGLHCIETAGVAVLLSPTSSCNRIDRLEGNGLAIEHSQTVRNAPDQQPVYFKESVKLFLRTPTGLAFVYVNVARSANLGRAVRWIAGGKIEESQTRQIEALRQLLTR